MEASTTSEASTAMKTAPTVEAMPAMKTASAMEDWNEDAYIRPCITIIVRTTIRVRAIVRIITAIINRNGNTS
jgi:hypothetical protein